MPADKAAFVDRARVAPLINFCGVISCSATPMPAQ